MARKSIKLAVAIGIAVCATLPASGESTDPDVCEAGTPPAATNIFYRDSHIQAQPPETRIETGKKWEFRLTAPSDPRDESAYLDESYADAIVTIKGKTGTRTDKWLHVAGTRDDSPLSVCVPTWLKVGETVFFTVTAESLGTLDPRGDVVN